MYKLKKVTVVAFVIGAMGAVSDLFEKYTGKLNVTIRLEMIRKRRCWEQLDYYGSSGCVWAQI